MDLERSVRHAATEVVARGELAGLPARSQRIGGRMGLLQRARPDGDGPVLEVAALPAERLRFGPRLEDQLHALVGALPRLLRVEVVGHRLVGRPPQESHDQAPLGQGVEHRQLLGHAHRIAVRDDGAEQGDRDPLQAGRDVALPRRSGRESGCAESSGARTRSPSRSRSPRRTGAARSCPGRPGAGLAVVHPGRHRPLGRQGPGRSCSARFRRTRPSWRRSLAHARRSLSS